MTASERSGLGLKRFSIWRTKGYKCNLNRFQSVVRDARSLLKVWYPTLMVAEYCALKCDFLKSKSLASKFKIKSSGADVQADVNATGATSVGERSIRSVAQNAVVIAVLTMQDHRHHRLISMVVHGARPVDRWHSVQNVECRDTVRGAAWALAQIQSEYLLHCYDCLVAPWQEDAAAACGFGTPGGEGSKVKFDNGHVMVEDEFAGTFGTFALALTAARLKRFVMRLSSWPWSIARVLGNPEEAAGAVAELRTAFADYETLRDYDGQNRAMKRILERAVFNQAAVMQLVHALKESNWELTAAFLQLVRDRLATCFGTQIVEDINNVQKNDRAMGAPCSRSGTTHYRRPESSFAVALTRNVVDEVHRFNRVDPKAAVARRTASLQENVFRSAHGSLPWHSIATTKQTAAYFSPAPVNEGIPAADHTLLRDACRAGCLADVGNAWLGFFAQAPHQIVFRFKNPLSEFMLALHHYPDSAVLVWPVYMDMLSLKGGHQIVVPKRASRPHFVTVLSLANIECFTFQWRSWAWQRGFLKDNSSLRPGVRPIRDAYTQLQPVLNVLAERAFFRLDKTTITEVCQHEGYELEPHTNLFDTVFEATQTVLGLSSADTLDVMKIRFASLPTNYIYTGDLLEVDEAAACLDENDRGELIKLQKETVGQGEEKDMFVQHFRQRREALAREAAPKSRAKKAKVSDVPSYNGPDKLPEAETLLQKDLKAFACPGGYIWVARTSGAWCTRLPPFKPFFRYWKKEGGEHQAACAALRDLWTCYLESNGLGKESCPIRGLFARGGAPASSSK